MSKIRVAFVGAGQIAHVHATALQSVEGATLTAVVDAAEGKAESFARKWGVESWGTELAEEVARSSPDVVHVLVPPEHHAAVAIEAAGLGCHLLVEKPLAPSLSEAKTIQDAATAAGVRLCVNHNFLFEPLVQTALARVRDGVVGDVVSAEGSFIFDVSRNPVLAGDDSEYGHWSFLLNGGILQDLAPHPASFLAEFYTELGEVGAVRKNLGVLPEGHDDELRVVFDSDSILGSLRVSLSERPDTVELVIRGTKGTVHVDLFSNVITQYRPGALPRAAERGLMGFSGARQHLGSGLRNVWNVARGRMDKTGGIASLLTAFYGALANDEPMPVSQGNAFRVVELIDRIWPEPSAGTRRVRDARTQPRVRFDAPAEVLVTGATGFIGGHLVDRLVADGVRVRALVRPGSTRIGRLRTQPVELMEIDLSEGDRFPEAVAGVRHVYHIGQPMHNDPRAHAIETVEATRALAAAAREAGVERFVYPSTLALADTESGRSGTAIDEDVGYSPKLGPYAEAKKKVEGLLRDAADQGLHTVMLRPGIVIGPRGRVVYPHMGYKLRDRVFIILGKGNAPLPLTYVGNTVAALIQATTAEVEPGSLFHIVDPDPITGKQYLEQFIQDAALEARIVHVPFAFAYSAAGGYELAAALRVLPAGKTSREQLRQKRQVVDYDCTRARELLGWQPEVSLREGLTRTFEWYGRRWGGLRSRP